VNSPEQATLAVIEDWKKSILEIPGVTGIARGRGSQKIIIYVEKLSNQVLSAIPSKLDGIPVQVKTTGKIRLLQARTDRWRPLVGGISIGHPQITAGTYTERVADAKTGESLIMSNNHVIALNWGDKVVGKVGDSTLQPGPYDGGKDPADKVGELDRWVTVEKTGENLVDAAVARLTAPEGTKPGAIDIYNASYSIEATPGMRGRKSGRTTGTTESTVESVGAVVDVEGWGSCRFADVIIFRPAFAQGGDSGSLVVEATSGRVIGVLFAGGDEITAVCRAANVEKLLGVKFLPPAGVTPPLPTAVPALSFAAIPLFIGGLMLAPSLMG
jgi:hypothetical protein